MKKLAGRALLLCALLALSYAGLLLAFPNRGNDYFAAMIDKDALLERTPSPRILFVGGSNLAFSLDSERAEQALGLPVVNLGLNAELGLRYMLSQAEAHVGPGDRVVVSAEYGFLGGNQALDGDPLNLASLISAYPAALRYLRTPRQAANVFVGLMQVQQNKMLNPVSLDEAVYVRAGFNRHGDVVSHLGRPARSFVPDSVLGKQGNPVPSAEAVALINELSAAAEAQGGQLSLIWPAVPASAYAESQSGLDALDVWLRGQARFAVLGRPRDATYPLSEFYDSDYHMTGEGRAANTERIIAELKAAW